MKILVGNARVVSIVSWLEQYQKRQFFQCTAIETTEIAQTGEAIYQELNKVIRKLIDTQ